MNRVIKFRAWSVEDKAMSLETGYTDVFRFKVGDTIYHRFSSHCELMQFTGLLDKNGKEIYEGDVMDYGNQRYMPVEFINGCFCICKNTAMPTLMTLYPVIGNIYENPELLK